MNRQISDINAYCIPVGSVMVSSQNTVRTTSAPEVAYDLGPEERIDHINASHDPRTIPRKLPVQQTPHPDQNEYLGFRVSDRFKVYTVWLLVGGAYAASGYGLYVLVSFLVGTRRDTSF